MARPTAISTLLLASALVVPVACGSTDSDAGRSDASAGAGGSGGSAGSASGGAAGSGGISLFDAGGGSGGMADAATDPITVADAGWFECGGCLCDGTTHYCEQISAGVNAPSPPEPPDGATLCSTKEAGNDCLPLPTECAGVPSCGCVPKPYGDICSCNDVGGGLLVHCALP